MSFEEAQLVSSIESSPGCIKAALCILGDKWTPLLISQLAEKSLTFSELEKRLNGISPRTLSQRLQSLLENGIIMKQQYNEHPPRHNYHLTPKGADLTKILESMAAWGENHKASN